MPLDTDRNNHLHHYDHHEHLDVSPHNHHHHNVLDSNCSNSTALALTEHHHNIDLVTTLRSELAALSYKKDKLISELSDVKLNLCTKDVECENLRAQIARQSTLISSLQSRLQASENREQSVQSRCDATIQTIQNEKRSADERCKELLVKIQHLENHLSNEETQKEQAHNQLNDFLRRLSICFGMEVCENAHLNTECIFARAEELITELQRTKAKVNSTCDTLSSCENELLNLKTLANIEKQRLSAQLESAGNHEHELETRCRQYERDLQMHKERFSESEMNFQKLKDELRGFESRCHRLQTHLDRVQNDRLQFLRCLANHLNLTEPCETLIKDKLVKFLDETRSLHEQIHTLRDEISSEHLKLKESQETVECRLRNEEAQKIVLEERLEKYHTEIDSLRKDHMGLSEYLQRLATALQWSECSSLPALGNDTNIMAECLLEKAEHLALSIDDRHIHHERMCHDKHQYLRRTSDKICCDHSHHAHNKLRRERSCHDIPLKESTSTFYNLQRKICVLKEQLQRRDLHLELLKRKLAIIEDGARGKCLLQGERDEAMCRVKKANKQIDKLTVQLADARSQIAEVKTQLTEAVEYKILALERARKIDELTAQICNLEEQKTNLFAQINAFKEKLKSSSESNQNRRCRDETLINSLRSDLNHVQGQLSEANHRLTNLQNFRTSVARTLHLRDLPETDLLQRLQALCSAHQEFTMLSKRFETASSVGVHTCSRYDDPVLSSSHCQPPRCSVTAEEFTVSAGIRNHNLNHTHGQNNNLHYHNHPHRYH
ncbi:uncharacterized protein ACRADG_004909 isoform 2-T2 [Cochliomyia hominivorax]